MTRRHLHGLLGTVLTLAIAACGATPQAGVHSPRSASAGSTAAAATSTGSVVASFNGLPLAKAFRTLATTSDIADVRIEVSNPTGFTQAQTFERTALVAKQVTAAFDAVPVGTAKLVVTAHDADGVVIGTASSTCTVRSHIVTELQLKVKLSAGIAAGSIKATISFEDGDNEATSPGPSAPPSNAPSAPPSSNANGTTGSLPTLRVGGHAFNADLFASDQSHQMGPAGWNAITAGWAVVLYWPQPASIGLWMANMKIPLDLICASGGKVISIMPNMQPCPADTSKCNAVFPATAVDYVAEFPAGTAAMNGIRVGDSISLSL